MGKTEGTGIFIYGNETKDTASVTWRLKVGNKLSDDESWRVVIKITDSKPSQSADILKALQQEFIFKLKIEDNSVFSCGLYDLEEFVTYYPDLYIVICSRDQNMVKLR